MATVLYKKRIELFFVVATIMIAGIQTIFAQGVTKGANDFLKTVVNDSMLPTLVLKIASYTSTIDHTDFLIKRKFNITPISLNLPEIERKVKGFKTRLETKGNRMNLRSLNSGVIMLKEITKRLSSYQRVLNNYSTQLTQSNGEIKKNTAGSYIKHGGNGQCAAGTNSGFTNRGPGFGLTAAKNTWQSKFIAKQGICQSSAGDRYYF